MQATSLEELATETPHILVVDDDSSVRDLLKHLLERQGYAVTTASNGRDAVTRLETKPYHLVITDLKMPGLDGMEVMSRCKAVHPITEVIILTGHGSIETAIEAMRKEVYDYVTKPFEISRVRTSVRNALTKQRLTLENAELIRQIQAHQTESEKRIREATRELREANRKLAQLAITDPLTGLYNRRYFGERLSEEVSRATRYADPLSLSMIDIDDFKAYNDTHGHPAGDEALQRIAETLRQGLRQGDVVARWGGEEFTIILCQTPGHQALTTVDRLREAVVDMKLSVMRRGKQSLLTISAGVSAFSEQIGDADTLITRADEALYQAKREGKNRVCLADA